MHIWGLILAQSLQVETQNNTIVIQVLLTNKNKRKKHLNIEYLKAEWKFSIKQYQWRNKINYLQTKEMLQSSQNCSCKQGPQAFLGM